MLFYYSLKTSMFQAILFILSFSWHDFVKLFKATKWITTKFSKENLLVSIRLFGFLLFIIHVEYRSYCKDKNINFEATKQVIVDHACLNNYLYSKHLNWFYPILEYFGHISSLLTLACNFLVVGCLKIKPTVLNREKKFK